LNVDIATKLPTVLSLCSGYGGIERGLDLAGVEHRVLAHVEIEAFAIANLVAKMENGQLPPAPIWSNLKTLPVEPFRDRVDILTGGYPCTPFSHAGKRQGKDDSQGRHLWPYIVDIIKSVRPVRCFFENVEGHISLGLRDVLKDLAGLGYRSAWGIFSAAEVSVCEQYPKGVHQRKRVFIMADSNGSRQQAQRYKSRAERQAQPARQSSELGDAANIRRKRRGATTELKRSANIQEQSESNLRGELERSSQTLADSGSKGLQGREWLRVDDEKDSRGQKSAHGPIAECGDDCRAAFQRGQEESWPPEPRILRVVDGCADRVDRIRLLGNGVVPATAAKAWRVLSDEIALRF